MRIPVELPTTRPKETRVHEVVPFRAWRYAPAAGDLTLLVAPPYDVVGPDLQSRLYARSRYNVVRIDLGMTTPSDNECDNRYTRAAAQLAEWKGSGILVRDSEPSLTFVEEEFTGPDGRPRVRHGFLAAVRLREFWEGVVYPHEETFSEPKQDRFELMNATAMGLSPVFLLYELPGDEITSAWRAGPGARPPATVVFDETGNLTKLWPTSDPDLLTIAGQNLDGARFIIADGHHRYETALRYREHRRRGEMPPLDLHRAYEYVLAYLSNMADPGLTIYPTHRLVSGVDPDRVAKLPALLAGSFAVEPLEPETPASGAGRAATILDETAKADATVAARGRRSAADRRTAMRAAIEGYLAAHPRGTFVFWAPGLDKAYGLRLLDPGAVAAATPGRSAAYRGLDVIILQKLVLERVLGLPGSGPEVERHVTFFKDSDEALARLAAGDFQAGFFMNPTGLDQVREVAFGGERMPQKATYFYPKLPTGLVFQDLSGPL
jgi:uncharacterized protein (DUF1015 family)